MRPIHLWKTYWRAYGTMSVRSATILCERSFCSVLLHSCSLGLVTDVPTSDTSFCCPTIAHSGAGWELFSSIDYVNYASLDRASIRGRDAGVNEGVLFKRATRLFPAAWLWISGAALACIFSIFLVRFWRTLPKFWRNARLASCLLPKYQPDG